MAMLFWFASVIFVILDILGLFLLDTDSLQDYNTGHYSILWRIELINNNKILIKITHFLLKKNDIQ